MDSLSFKCCCATMKSKAAFLIGGSYFYFYYFLCLGSLFLNSSLFNPLTYYSCNFALNECCCIVTKKKMNVVV